jgi:hypothetical protein
VCHSVSWFAVWILFFCFFRVPCERQRASAAIICTSSLICVWCDSSREIHQLLVELDYSPAAIVYSYVDFLRCEGAGGPSDLPIEYACIAPTVCMRVCHSVTGCWRPAEMTKLICLCSHHLLPTRIRGLCTPTQPVESIAPPPRRPYLWFAR